MSDLTEWDYILKLTEKELHSVIIIHDNADFIGENSVIVFKITLDKKYGGDGVAYFGDTKLDCLKKAYNEYMCELIDELEKQIAELKEQSNKDDKTLNQVIGERDHWESKATELADLVGGLLHESVGEHSSMNCPVSNAIELLKDKEIT